MFRALRVFLITAQFFLLGTLSASAQEFGKDSLRQLPPFDVVIEQPSSVSESLGLTTTDLRTFTELRLRRNGIAIVPHTPDSAGPAYFYVRVTPICRPAVCAITTEVAMVQSVVLPNGKRCMAKTYDIGNTGLEPMVTAKRGTMETLGDLVDRFSNLYLEVNPK